jgi:hypothetical protein
VLTSMVAPPMASTVPPDATSARPSAARAMLRAGCGERTDRLMLWKESEGLIWLQFGVWAGLELAGCNQVTLYLLHAVNRVKSHQ